MMRHELQPGDRIIWLRCPGRSILSGAKIEEMPGVVVRICKYRLRILAHQEGQRRIVNVNPDNVLTSGEVGLQKGI
jgi:hypothetical protein